MHEPRRVETAHVVTPVVLATLTFVVYSRSLLPGLDLGDTAAFQAAVAWPIPSVRQSYPLYYATAVPFVSWFSPADPARGLNLLSAVWGAIAVGLLAWVTTAIGRSAVGGAAAALLFAFSYTFWSQAVIAEVYTLHLALVGAALAALHAYSIRPTRTRLAIFCGVYALGFGNHLSLVLWLAPCAALILLVHPAPRQLFRPGSMLLVSAIALAGALQYLPVAVAGWTAVGAPPSWGERAAALWAETTMADWRGSMVFGIEASGLNERLAMWLWDARQQFGAAGVSAALVGGVLIWWLSPPWAVLLWLAYGFNTVFAVTYNVGDPHVFFLPGHFLTACAAGIGISGLLQAAAGSRVQTGAARAALAPTVAALVLGYGAWRGWSTWPAAERTDDRRATRLVLGVARGLDARSLLISGLNWDQQNALNYAAQYLTPRLAWTPVQNVIQYAPMLIADNHRIGRDVVLDDAAASAIAAAHALDTPAFGNGAPPGSIAAVVARLSRGTPYVLTVLPFIEASPADRNALDAAVTALTGGGLESAPRASIVVLAGVSGAEPSVQWAAERPFQRELPLVGERLTVRIDAWVPVETFRRGGFGHVIAGRERLMYIERGVSLLWFDTPGPRVAYAAGPYAEPSLFTLPADRTQLAAAPVQRRSRRRVELASAVCQRPRMGGAPSGQSVSPGLEGC